CSGAGLGVTAEVTLDLLLMMTAFIALGVVALGRSNEGLSLVAGSPALDRLRNPHGAEADIHGGFIRIHGNPWLQKSAGGLDERRIGDSGSRKSVRQRGVDRRFLALG